ncbi:hypothetical protein H9P43_006314 [Blastocladiella emersonii ATCC 22665]|nr:hypothetical protein H9P43_006314 [Blastocladiella emersonii ATCC 22665]
MGNTIASQPAVPPVAPLRPEEEANLRALIAQGRLATVADFVAVVTVAELPPTADLRVDAAKAVANAITASVVQIAALFQKIKLPNRGGAQFDRLVVQATHLIHGGYLDRALEKELEHFDGAQRDDALLIVNLLAWYPLYRTCAGVASPAPPPVDDRLPLPPALRSKELAPPPPAPAEHLATFANAQCRPKPVVVPDSLLDWALRSPDRAAVRQLVPTLAQVFAMYITRPYLRTDPAPVLPSLLNDRLAGRVLPRLDLLGAAPTQLLLQPHHILAVAASLPPPARVEWRLAFSSARDGASWSALVAGLVKGTVRSLSAAATLLVIRDARGHVFAGYTAAAPLPLGPRFLGDADLHPWQLISPGSRGDPGLVCVLHPGRIRVYRPTGRNAHYVYANAGAATLPSGIGFGGQMEHFGLWLAADLQRGHSRTAGEVSSTYGNPVLSAESEFDVDAVEAWVVDNVDWARDPDAEVGSDAGKSVLAQFPELVDLLEMGGRKMYSKEIGEPPAPIDFDSE